MKHATVSIVIGVLFLIIGFLGFISNPIVGDSGNAIFHADTTHNIIHLASGLLFILFGTVFRNSAGGFMMLFGIVYLALGVLGLINVGSSGMGTLLGFLHVNGADNILHIALGILIFMAAAIRSKSSI